MELTIGAGVVGLDVYGLDLAALDDEGVALGARVPEDGDHVEAEIQGLGEGARGVRQEPDLRKLVSTHPSPSPSPSHGMRSRLTPDILVGSSWSPQAFMLSTRQLIR